jgi:transcriptional regulator with XRE-family HTH domain
MKPKDFNFIVGNNLSRIMKLASKSRSDIARLLSVCEHQVMYYEKGLSGIGAEKLFLLANALRVNINDFLPGGLSSIDYYNFDNAFGYTMQHGDGYYDDPCDAGEEKRFGISKRSYPNIDIKNITIDDAKEILYTDFWCKNKCTEIVQLNDGTIIASKLFDLSISVGISEANKILQRALMSNGFLLKDDGILGPLTMEAIEICLLRGKSSWPLLVAMRSEAASYYRCLNPSLRNKDLDVLLNRAYDNSC